MRIILIGNYTLDKQESMIRFAHMLELGFKEAGIQTELWNPVIFFGKGFKSTKSGVSKWVGYLDKFFVFPLVLRIRLRKKRYRGSDVIFHVCDHSNAPYLKYLPKGVTGITCHDVLAIRGSMGHADAYAPASRFGKILQSWILRNLEKAEILAAVSHFTLNQFKDLSKSNLNERENWVVIHNAFNAPFFPMEKEQCQRLLLEKGIGSNDNYILHVGNEHPRKNRAFLLDVLYALGEDWNGKVCFAGTPLDKKLLDKAKHLNLKDRIISVVKPSHDHLVALYNGADAFMFPSLSEGFGWPVIEAQACGTPVIASSFQPMPEVSGDAALHPHPKDAKAFSEAFLSLKDDKVKCGLINAGFENIKRFQVKYMIDSYLRLYSSNLNSCK